MTGQDAGRRGDILGPCEHVTAHRVDGSHIGCTACIRKRIDAAVAEAVAEGIKEYVDDHEKCVEEARSEERAACVAIARQWADSKSCAQHDDNPCCHVRTGEGIANAIALRPAGAPEGTKADRMTDEEIDRAIAKTEQILGDLKKLRKRGAR